MLSEAIASIKTADAQIKKGTEQFCFLCYLDGQLPGGGHNKCFFLFEGIMGEEQLKNRDEESCCFARASLGLDTDIFMIVQGLLKCLCLDRQTMGKPRFFYSFVDILM